MGERAFRISLNPGIVESFDEALDEQEHISAQQVFSEKRYRGLNAWDCICSCVHRIRDTVGYLNDMELGRMAHGNAFDFMEFMNNAAVVIDSKVADFLGQRKQDFERDLLSIEVALQP